MESKRDTYMQHPEPVALVACKLGLGKTPHQEDDHSNKERPLDLGNRVKESNRFL